MKGRRVRVWPRRRGWRKVAAVLPGYRSEKWLYPPPTSNVPEWWDKKFPGGRDDVDP